MPLPHHRRRAVTADLHGVVLVGTAPGGELRSAVAGLQVGPAGLAVTDPTGRVVRHWTWTAPVRLQADGCAHGADGLRQVLEVEADGRAHHFLVPAFELSPFLAALTRIEAAAPALTWVDGPEATAAPAPDAAAADAAAGGAGADGGTTRRTDHREVRSPSRLVRLLRATVGARAGRRALAGAGVLAALVVPGSSPVALGASHHPAHHGGNHHLVQLLSDGLGQNVPLNLPAATAPPEPAPPSLANAPALSAHEVFGYAPYWTLPIASAFDVQDMSTLAYFSVDANGDGTIAQSGPGWNGYQSQALADLVTRAHQAGDRVVLTVTCFDQGNLDKLAADPQSGTTLGNNLVGLLQAKNLDGVNVDFEGTGPGDRAGMARMMHQLSTVVHGADPHWQVTMATYASSAGDGGGGFYDIPALAPSVDAFFVMAYDMDDPSRPSPTAGLGGPVFTDQAALAEYTAVVDPSKVILGVPYYGYDWPTAGPGLGDPATGPPTPMSYAQIAAAGHPVYWDPTSQTAWTSYQVGTTWHQTWFDDPTSLALKAALADQAHVRGVGIWALGMDGNDPAMLAALLGHAPATKDRAAGPGPTTTSTTTTTAAPATTTVAPAGSPAPGAPPVPVTTRPPSTTTTGAGTTTTTAPPTEVGTFDGSVFPVTVTTSPPAPGAPVGTFTLTATDDPSHTCLIGVPLPVYALDTSPGTYLVQAAKQAACTQVSWLLQDPGGPGGTGGPGPTTTTTG